MPEPPSASSPSARAGATPLRRVKDDALVAGVCAGIARSVGLPALLVRLITLVVVFAIPPLALITYAGLAVALPRDDGRVLLAGDPKDARETIVGWALIVLTIITVAAGLETSFVGGPGGLMLLAGGALLLIVQHQRTNPPRALDRPVAQQGPTPPPSAVPAGASPQVFRHESPYPGPQLKPLSEVVAGEPIPAGADVTAPTMALTPMGSVEHPPAREASVGVIGAAVLVGAAALAVVVGALGAFDVSAKWVAAALGLGAVAMTASAIVLSRRRGAVALIVFAVLMALGSLGAATVGPHVEHGVGDRVEYPVTASELAKQYRFGIGSYTIDLTGAELSQTVTTVHARLGIGELVVIVPPGVQVESVGRTRVGGVRYINARADGGVARTIRVDADVEHGSAEIQVAPRFVP